MFPVIIGPYSLKDFITLSIFDYEYSLKHFPTYTTKIKVLYMNIQGSTFLTIKLQSKKPFHNCSYHRRTTSYWPYILVFDWRTTSQCTPSLLKYLVSSVYTRSLIGISAQAKVFLSSILWIFKPIIYWRINIYLSLVHLTTS